MVNNEKIVNATDPIVIIDPEFDRTIIPKEYIETSTLSARSFESSINIDGIFVPIIKVNNRVLAKNEISMVDIKYSGFLPTIRLVVKDLFKNIQYSDVPGVVNIISVIMTCNVDGTYRKITTDFYIKYADFYNDTIIFEGEYKFNALEKTECRQIGKGELTTFELLKTIATETKLGFAATEDCSNVQDKRYRQIYSRKLKDYIVEQINLGGTDENTIFDCWIDPFGYIVLVNLKWVFDNVPDIKELLIYQETGLYSTDSQEGGKQISKVPKILTNAIGTNNSNLSFNEYNSILDTSKIKECGGLCNFYYLKDACVKNELELKQIQLIDASIDGIENSQDYEFETIKFIGTEMAEQPILFQQEIHKMELNKIQSQQIELVLVQPNFGLERGTLVAVEFVDYNPVHKKFILDNHESVYSNKPTTIEDTEALTKNKNTPDITNTEEQGVINPALTGYYYIESMKFNYNSNAEKISQYLYLTKVGLRNNLLNANTVIKTK